jgi:GNAT superfamily N-acetyltransferase
MHMPEPQTYQNGDYTISTDPARLDVAAVYAYLSRAYWAQGRPLDVVRRSLEHSLCFGVYHGDAQVGLARVITDFATFAYLCDVYILDEHQGHGLGKWLISVVTAHPDLRSLRRFLLATRDAHGLYRQYGFDELMAPERWMEKFQESVSDNR